LEENPTSENGIKYEEIIKKWYVLVENPTSENGIKYEEIIKKWYVLEEIDFKELMLGSMKEEILAARLIESWANKKCN